MSVQDSNFEPIVYVIKGNPTPKAAAKHAHRRTYDSQKQLRAIMRVEIESQHGDRPMYSGALELTCRCFFGFPENMSEKKKMALVGKPHTYKPDSSNLQKLIEDVCNKVIYHDDSAIAVVHFYKVYDYVPRTEFIITEIK